MGAVWREGTERRGKMVGLEGHGGEERGEEMGGPSNKICPTASKYCEMPLITFQSVTGLNVTILDML